MKRILLMLAVCGTASCYAQNDQGNSTMGNDNMNPACINAPLNFTSETKEVTVGNAATTTTDKEYVYYHRKGRIKHACSQEFADLPDPKGSKPILLSASMDMQAKPQAYNVALSTPQDHVTVCADSALGVQANISVNEESEYTGNYPATTKNTYKEVSKRTYKRTARKMRNAERKENRVARLTGTPVQTSASM